MGYKVDKTAIVGENVKIGEGTRIWQFSNVMKDVEIGDDCNIGQNVFIESGVKLGNKVTVKNNIALYSGVTCEDKVFLGPNCVFTNVLNPRSFISRKDEFLPTTVKEGASIGANATIVCGHDVGKYALVGAGAVITKDVEDYALVVGNPARKIGYVCECCERIYDDGNGIYECKRCGKKYKMTDGKLTEIK